MMRGLRRSADLRFALLFVVAFAFAFTLLRAGVGGWLLAPRPGSVALWEVVPLRPWVFGAAALTILVPAGLILAHRRDPTVRRALLPVMLFLLVQVGVEGAAQRLNLVAAVPLVGLAGSLWRLVQLRRAWGLLGAARPVPRAWAAASMLFWLINAALLVVMLATGW